MFRSDILKIPSKRHNIYATLNAKKKLLIKIEKDKFVYYYLKIILKKKILI